jgi:hypothetical protein
MYAGCELETDTGPTGASQNANMPDTEQRPYYVRTEGDSVMVVFRSGVRIRLIATQDQESGSWKVRLPHGVSIDPKIWRTLARRALLRFVRYRENDSENPR